MLKKSVFSSFSRHIENKSSFWVLISAFLALALFVESAKAEVFCVKTGFVCRPRERCTEKAVKQITVAKTCPAGFQQSLPVTTPQEVEDLIASRIRNLGTGPQGAQGPTGPQGPQGPAGAQGPQGPAGQSAILNQTWIRDYFDWWDMDLPSNPYGTVACSAPEVAFPGNSAAERMFVGLEPGAVYMFSIWGSIPGSYPDNVAFDFWVAASSWLGGLNTNLLWKRLGGRGPNYPDGSALFSNSVPLTADATGSIRLRYRCGMTLSGLSYFRIR